tara:strand:- start:79 stop:384 length:306 start_codon:yes stop_codon:yes gene_type:complete
MRETKEELEEEAKICYQSIEWWKSEMSSLIARSDELEEQDGSPEYEDKMDAIRLQMNYLLYKGEWENKQIFSLQQRISKYKASKPFGTFQLLDKKPKKRKK